MDADRLDALVDAARAGGHWAFERLWQELSPRVSGYLRGRGVGDADDVTSEVFLAAFQGMGTFNGDGAAFRSWLFTIAHHRGVDWQRRAARNVAQSPY
ncbi:MAG: RNA polymerase sigma factor, partial [Actinomycetes bacterium]